MTGDRIEQLRAERKKREPRGETKPYLSWRQAEAALTEALDRWELRHNSAEETICKLSVIIAEQGRLLERTQGRLSGVHEGWLAQKSCQCSRGAPCIVAVILTDLDARTNR